MSSVTSLQTYDVQTGIIKTHWNLSLSKDRGISSDAKYVMLTYKKMCVQLFTRHVELSVMVKNDFASNILLMWL